MDENGMKTGLVRHIKFPLTFEVERLQRDVRQLLENQWTAHYNTNDYQGDWTSLSLLSVDGKSGNIYAMPLADAVLMETEIMASCPYFKEILDGLPFKKTAVRLLRLAAGAEVKPHSDHCLGYEDGTFRLHIPVITNAEVEFILDGQRLVMNEGECWYINANFIHSVSNKGTQDRIHLVIDGERNDWTDALFFKDHDESQFQKPVKTIKEDEKDRIIAELMRLDTPAAHEIISKLKGE